ncbi:GNAT family protein [Clostridium sp.]|jgi:RimJ/RimL family protein N-acetyltransferase|uniref:GNAT family N-acetyltransferase n=1 Tax=Clostridium sp. TaxID=1506 RepID=UPI00258373E9|nr:GNAT family protein [Clostridium sp.]MDF2505947.1 family acetyltransferase [Clostridium sp.]
MKNITLGNLEIIHLENIMKFFNNNNDMDLFCTNVFKHYNDSNILTWYTDKKSDSRIQMYSILLKNIFIGYCEIYKIDLHNLSCHISIAITDSANRGKGYGKCAIEQLICYIFRNLGLNRIELMVFDYNLSAINLYEEIGFLREGILREYLLKNNVFYNVYIYGLLKIDWTKKYDIK